MWLCWYKRDLQELSGGCVGTEEYYRSTWEAVLVQKRVIGALGRLCWYRRVYRSTRVAMLLRRVL